MKIDCFMFKKNARKMKSHCKNNIFKLLRRHFESDSILLLFPSKKKKLILSHTLGAVSLLDIESYLHKSRNCCLFGIY